MLSHERIFARISAGIMESLNVDNDDSHWRPRLVHGRISDDWIPIGP